FSSLLLPPPRSPPFPYTTLFRSMIVTAPCIASCEIAASLSNRFGIIVGRRKWVHQMQSTVHAYGHAERLVGFYDVGLGVDDFQRSEEHTSELQSRENIVCRLLLE